MLSKAKPEDQLTQTQQISVEVKQSEETTEPDGVYQETTQQSSKMDSMEFQVKIKTSPIDTSEEKRKGILLQQKKIDERESKDQLKRIVIDTKSSGKVYRDHERLERAGNPKSHKSRLICSMPCCNTINNMEGCPHLYQCDV